MSYFNVIGKLEEVSVKESNWEKMEWHTDKLSLMKHWRWRHSKLKKKMKCWRSFQPSAPNMSNDSTEVLEKHCKWEHQQTHPEGWEESLMLPYQFYLCLASPDLEGKKEAAPVRTSSHISKCGDEPRWARSWQIHLHDLCAPAKVCPDVELHVVSALLWITFCLGKAKKPCWTSFCISAVFWGQARHSCMKVQAQLCHWCALPPLRKERCPMIPCPRYTLSAVFHAEGTVPGLPVPCSCCIFPSSFLTFSCFPNLGIKSSSCLSNPILIIFYFYFLSARKFVLRKTCIFTVAALCIRLSWKRLHKQKDQLVWNDIMQASGISLHPNLPTA